jgi:hypothetical protein
MIWQPSRDFVNRTRGRCLAVPVSRPSSAIPVAGFSFTVEKS